MRTAGKYTIALLLPLLLGSTESLIGSDYEDIFSFKQISLDQGLPGSNVRDIYQDSKGIVWISIEATGICRYTGNKFVLVKHNPDETRSISSSYTNMVVEDSTGIIWIATDGGLNKYDRVSDTYELFLYDSKNPESIPHNIINTLYVDLKGDLWIGTGNGMGRYNHEENSFERYFYTEDINIGEAINVQCIYEHTNGYLYLGTNRGLIEFDPKLGSYRHWEKSANLKNTPIHNLIRTITGDNSGLLWIGTHRGVNKFNVKTREFITFQYHDQDIDELEHEGLNTIYKDEIGRIWFGTYTKGIVIVDPENDSYLRITKEDNRVDGLQSNHIRVIYKDRSDVLWIGTKFEGIFKYDLNKEIFNKWPSHYKAFLPIKGKHILSFSADKKRAGVYWVGSKFDGLFKVDVNNSTIKNYRHNKDITGSLSANRIETVVTDYDGVVWIGSESALNYLNPSTNIIRKYPSPSLNYLLVDSNMNLWIGTTTGVLTLDKERDELIQYPSSHRILFDNPNLDILFIHEDPENIIWFSTRYNGLFGYNTNDDSVIHFTREKSSHKGISGNMIRPLFTDTKGFLWIGTKAEGLNRYDPRTGTFKVFTTEDGLPSDFILCIEEDLKNNIWFGTYNGLSKFNPESNVFTNFNKDYGLQGNIFHIGMGHRLDDGYMIFGGHNGINIFHPDSITKIEKKSALVLNSVKVFGKEILRDISEYQVIYLDYKQNYISFEFFLTDYGDPFHHQFAYMLEGMDSDWNYSGNRNYVSYTSLEPGEYTFLMKAANELGDWIDEPLRIDLIISPPFYATWLFRISAIVLAISLAYAYYVIKIRSVSRSKAILEQQITERTKKLNETNKELRKQYVMVEDQKKEIEMHHSQLELMVQERTKDLEKAKEKAIESDRLKSSFLANMSHEIRTPLNAILGFTSLLEDKDMSAEERKSCFEFINVNSVTLLKLIDDIIDISIMEAGQLEVNKEYFSIEDIMEEIYITHREGIRHKKSNIKLKYKKDGNSVENPVFYSDPIRIKQVLSNLIENAIKYSDDGNIEFGYELNPGGAKFFVHDSGIGIAEKDQEAIFDRFVKVEGKAKLYRGTGLGLFICKSLVELMGGKIWVESEKGNGSKFFFTIPDKSGKKRSFDKQNIASFSEFDIKMLEGKSILIVEDEPSNYYYINTVLKKHKANIHWSKNGIEAIDVIESGKKFDIILMDLKMPQMNGYEALERIKKMEIKTPVIALTAYVQEGDRHKVFSAGFNGYLSKPVSKTELLHKINQHLKAS